VLNAQEQQTTAPAAQPVALQKPQLPKVQEYGIGFSSLNSYSLQYRWGNENRLYRIQGNIGGSSALKPSTTNGNPGYSPINFNFGLSFSILKIKSVSEKFGLMYGGNFGLVYSLNQNNSLNNSNTIVSKNKTESFQPYVGFALGAVYKINSSFLIYAEIDPSIYYNYQQSKTTNPPMPLNNTSSYTNSFGLQNLSNSGASLKGFAIQKNLYNWKYCLMALED